MTLTHEQIDSLEGRELDEAFAKAFGIIRATKCVWRCSQDISAALKVMAARDVDYAILRHGKAVRDKRYKASVASNPDWTNATGPTPAVALCRAAIKAKLAEEQK